MSRCISTFAFLCVAGLPSVALAQASPNPRPPPYSLPWLLRPAVVKTVVRSDTSVGFFDDGTAAASTLSGGVRIMEGVGVYAKAAFTRLDPDAGSSGNALSNPALFGLYVHPLGGDLRLGAALGVGLPLGQGGGNDPDPETLAAITSGVFTRLGMENALFAPNFLTPYAGVDLAWVADGWTLQVEATVLELVRVRGDAVERDDARTNSTSGVHLGYFVLPMLVPSVEFHYQRWLSTPRAVELDRNRREQASVQVGVRVPLKLDSVGLSPGIAYARPIDAPMTKASWQVVQLDVPVSF